MEQLKTYKFTSSLFVLHTTKFRSFVFYLVFIVMFVVGCCWVFFCVISVSRTFHSSHGYLLVVHRCCCLRFISSVTRGNRIVSLDANNEQLCSFLFSSFVLSAVNYFHFGGRWQKAEKTTHKRLNTQILTLTTCN